MKDYEGAPMPHGPSGFPRNAGDLSIKNLMQLCP
jgi:hypothetical protein